MLEKSSVEIKSVTTEFKDYEVEVEWDLTMRCNYSCSYCESYSNSGPTLLQPLETYSTALKYLRSYLNNKKAKVEILGGEPMLFNEWNKLLNEIHHNDFIPVITTNLSIKTKSLRKKLDNLKPKKCIDVSWHPQFADEQNIIKNIDLLYKKGYLKSISILGDKRYWDKVKNAYNSVSYTNLVSVDFIKDEAPGMNKIASNIIDYTEEEKNFITKTNRKDSFYYTTTLTYKDNSIKQLNGLTEFFANNITNFKGMNCDVGKLRLHIKPNGDVYPSACLLNFPQAMMGNIFKQDIKKPKRPIECPFNFCGCGPDLRINKYV